MKIKKRYITGFTPTGKLTIGNYYGSLKEIENLSQDENNEIFVFVSDLHALSTLVNSKLKDSERKNDIAEKTVEILKWIFASDINFKNVKVFVQSQVPEISELNWILTNYVSLGHLERMTQFKDKKIKLGNKTNFINVGLLAYPILMTSDILLFDVDYVPVGKDQKQHLEFVSEIAKRFNKLHETEIFKVPTPIISKKINIRSLCDPDRKKMSKSEEDKNCSIYLSDKREDILEKIWKAKTDSKNSINYDIENQKAISSMLIILSIIEKKEIGKIVNNNKHWNNYGDFKLDLIDKVSKFLAKYQDKYLKLDSEMLNKKMISDLEYVREIAQEKISFLKKKLFWNKKL